jgi:hypothetical protein
METIFKQWRRTSEMILLLRNPVAADLVGLAATGLKDRWVLVVCHRCHVIIYHHAEWAVTNWSSLETCLRSVIWFKVRADLNLLNQLKVIWRTEPMWNICIIWYFTSVINSNKQRSNEKLVGTVIRTSDLRDHRRACFQLSYAASLKSEVYCRYIFPDFETPACKSIFVYFCRCCPRKK